MSAVNYQKPSDLNLTQFSTFLSDLKPGSARKFERAGSKETFEFDKLVAAFRTVFKRELLEANLTLKIVKQLKDLDARADVELSKNNPFIRAVTKVMESVKGLFFDPLTRLDEIREFCESSTPDMAPRAKTLNEVKEPKFDVVVFGAGPVGITTACALKAMNQNLRICVLDKRPEPQRNHGLNIRRDSVSKINEILDEAFFSPTANVSDIKELKRIFANWNENFIRTNKIENDLAKTAARMGVEVVRDKECEINENYLNQRVTRNSNYTMYKIIRSAMVLIGADGSHSIVRKTVMKDKLADEKTLQYLIELKYQTEGKVTPRSWWEGSIEGSKCGNLDIESMNRKKCEEKKPVTLHIFVDKATYDLFRETQNGKMKGVFGNSWSLNEIKERAKKNPKIKRVYQTFRRHLNGIEKRGGQCYEEKISTLEMRIYRSKNAVKKYKDKYVLLAGDSNSGMILERGFNKGLKEASLCAQAVSTFFTNRTAAKKMPKEFIRYQKETRAIFKQEKWWAELKMGLINQASKVLDFLATKIFIPLRQHS